MEPTGPIVDDPNLTDKNSLEIRRSPTAPASRSGSRAGSRIGSHSPERLKEMNDHLERLKELGAEAID